MKYKLNNSQHFTLHDGQINQINDTKIARLYVKYFQLCIILLESIQKWYLRNRAQQSP